jgi:hypothetical protein
LILERLRYGDRKQLIENRKYLELMIGKKMAQLNIAQIYEARRSVSKPPQQRDNKEKELVKNFIEGFEKDRKRLVEDIINRYKEDIDSYEMLGELIQGICYSPIFSPKPEA